jgi:amino acid adenylation domain-containing protein
MENFSHHVWDPLETAQPHLDLLSEPNLHYIPFEPKEIESTIPVRFARVAASVPHKLAVKCKDNWLTYRELDWASDQIAEALLATIDKNQQHVALLFPHNLNAISAILGVLKAGKSYLVLDAASHELRLGAVLADARPGVILCDHEYLSLGRKLVTRCVHLLDVDEIEVEHLDLPVNLEVSPDSLAALFHTSGSTGGPKGVGRTHRQMLHYVWSNIQIYGVNATDRQALLSFLGFAGSTSDVFRALLSGAGLHLLSPWEASLNQLIAWLRAEGITLFHPAVELFRQLNERLDGSREFSSLRLIVLASQTLYKSDVEAFWNSFPGDCMLVNRYGMTEVGAATQFLIRRSTILDGEVVPVGYPVHDMEIYLVDEAGEIVEIGQIGEILVRSRYLAPGYWQGVELTRQAFLPDPDGGSRRTYKTGDIGRWQADGCLEHLGRKDDRVKIHGFRVELAAVEAALLELESISQAVVRTQQLKSGENRLVAYLVYSGSGSMTVSEVRSQLASRLPGYMIPTVMMVLKDIPVTASGKVDRRALPAPDASRPELEVAFQPPRTQVEAQLVAIWSDILGIEPLGIEDNFFDLGGSSLHATRILARIADRFQVSLAQNDFFNRPTIEGLAAIAAERLRLTDEDEIERLVALVENLSEQEAENLLLEMGLDDKLENTGSE